MKKIVFAILLGITASCSHLDKKPKVAFVSTHIDYASYEFQEAANSLKKELTVHAFSPSTEGELPPFNVKDLASYDLVLFEGLGARISLLQPQIDSIKKLTRVGFIRMDQAEGNLKKDIQKTMDSYWENGNIENYKGLFSFLAKELFGLNMPVPKPIVFPPYGYYHPDHEGLSPSLGTYLSWYESRKTAHQVKDASTIGLIYYQSNYVKKDMQAVDALIRNIESKGHRVVPLLGKGSFQVDSFFLKDQQPVVDVIIYGGMFLDFRNPERGIASAKKLNVPILGGIINSYKNIEAWENDIGGLAPEMTDRFYFTEKDGVFEPIVIGGTATSSNGQKKSTPISYQIDWRVDRALAWAKLRKTDNADKKILVTYYNEGGGKANIGADPDAYLNAPASLSNLLKAWKQEGYSTGDKPLPSGEQLTRQMVEYGSNVKTWSSQELEKRKRGARLIRIPKEKYLSWFNDYPKEQQLEVIRKWGTPPGRLMVQTDSTGKESIVIPLLEFGNIVFAPHPSWGLHNDPELIYANDPLPPNHAYIAFFEWMKREFKPHAYFSLFTQLSLMPGKLEGPSANDWVGKLIGSVPHINAAPLIAGASVGNKRRANALTIGHTTDIALAGISDSLKMVLRHIEDWKTATNPAVRGKLADKILQAAQAEGLNAVLNKNAEKPIPIYFNELERYIIDISLQKVPQGSHVLGEAPSGTKRESMIEAMLGSDFTGEERKQKALEYDSLLNLAPMEIEGLMKAFRGEYVESGPSGDPVRSPESLPAGRNPHPSNEKNIPTREAWEIGKKMADQLLVQHEKKHGPGSFPKKVAFVLWSSEITHSQGVLEAEILYLMGAEPVWNSKGQVMDVRIIPDSLLRRPRIDVLVTTSGTYRDHFMDKIQLLDKAVKLVTIIQSPSNWVRNHALEYQEALGLKTVDQGTQRIFSTSPNTYSTNIEFAIEDGESWENDSTLSNLYIDRMANSYGQNANSEYQKELFTENIMDVEAAAFGRSSNVHGIMDHPMVASYFGAINLAVKNKTGKNPDLYINDVSDPGEAKTVKLEEFYQKELRSRYLNPNWIKNMQDQGYEGARYMQGFTENLLAWDITHTDMVTQADWDAVFDTYVNDKNKLGLNAYFEKHNPFAQKELIHTLQEANSKGYWAPSEKQQEIIADRLDKLNNSDRVPSLNNISNTEVSGYEMVNETRKIITNTAPNQPQQDTILWVLLIIAALIIMGWFSDDKIR